MDTALTVAVPAMTRDSLRARYTEVRRTTLDLCKPLETEDYVIQSMDDASPPKWHLAHTTWFFETFLLGEYAPHYRPHHPDFAYLFNSYYVSAGDRHPRPRRGLLSRPTVEEILVYRRAVDADMLELIDAVSDDHWAAVRGRVVLGLNHEQQHQELLLMDLKHNLWCNPLRPAYTPLPAAAAGTASKRTFVTYEPGTYNIGHDGDGFAFDNETPRHEVRLGGFRIGARCVTNGEWLEFIEAGGYDDALLWLSDGWATAQREGWRAPLYWDRDESGWQQFTLGGMKAVDEREPVVHVSFYEADAFARWRNARLPTEAEWEIAARNQPIRGNFLESGALHPHPPDDARDLVQMYGDVWEWTQSPYQPYPEFRPLGGGLGEYNGKFMINQVVQRGGSCLTPQSHIRPTYRNFFYPHQRWNTQGVRLARDLRPQ